MKIIKYLVKNFASKKISLPPLLSVKNPEKIAKYKTVREQNLKNLLLSEKLAENKNELENNIQKDLYEKNIVLNTKKLTLKFFSIQSEINTEELVSNLKNFSSKVLSIQEYNNLFNEIIKCKNNLTEDDIKYNEALFKILIDKISRITLNNDICDQLIKLISDIDFKQLDLNQIFLSKSNNSILSNSYDLRNEEKSTLHNNKNNEASKLDHYIDNTFNYISYNNEATNFLSIKNPFISAKLKNPEEEFKDAFVLNHQHKFTKPLLIQKSSENTAFNNSNTVYFENMPLIYPFRNLDYNENFNEDIDYSKYELTHINNHILLSCGYKVEHTFIQFTIKFLNECIAKYFKGKITDTNTIFRDNNKSVIVDNELNNEITKEIEDFLQQKGFNINENLLSDSLANINIDPSFEKIMNSSNTLKNKKKIKLDKIKNKNKDKKTFDINDKEVDANLLINKINTKESINNATNYNNINEISTEEINKDIELNRNNNKYRALSKAILNNEKFHKIKELDIDKSIKKQITADGYLSGFIEFNDYNEKVKFLKSPIRLFGLHILKNIANFYDADFCNVIEIKLNSRKIKDVNLVSNSQNFANNYDYKNKINLNEENNTDYPINIILNAINNQLIGRGITADHLLIQPEYIIPYMKPKVVTKNESLLIRTNSFRDTYNLLKTFKLRPISNLLKADIYFPHITYYNSYFLNAFDLILKNTLTDFNGLLSVKADYKI